MCLILHIHTLSDADTFPYGWRFRKAGEQVPSMSSFVDVPTIPKVQLTGASRSQTSQVEGCRERDIGASTRVIQLVQEYDEEDVEEEQTHYDDERE